jgi:dTDP-4-amino-4,6-dideoxygalactose transaminase
MVLHSGGRSRLAIFGSPPAFAEPLCVGRPNLPDKNAILERIAGALDRGWLTNGGPLVRQLEQRVAEITGVRHCIATASGTIGLELAAVALGLAGEVIVPAFTFIATAHALAWHGIRPVYCDVDPATHAIDPACVERLITERTSAICGVHLWGRACDVDALAELAARHGIRLFFDAAHAFGSKLRGRAIGGFGACEVFSFHATKFVHCAEGGAITTNDDLLAERLRLARNFGFADLDCVTSVGTNGKMSELSAAVGLTSLDNLGLLIAANRANYGIYRDRLGHVPGLRVLTFDAGDEPNYQYVVVEIDEVTAGLSRDELLAVLVAENVLARRYFFPGCHRMEPYASLLGEQRLPVAERLAQRVLVLPTGLQLGEAAIAQIASIIETAIANASRVRQQLGQRRAA